MTGQVFVYDSVTRLDPQVRGQAVIAASHGGLYSVHLAISEGVGALIVSDGGVGMDRAGISGLELAQAVGVPCAAIDHQSANHTTKEDHHKGFNHGCQIIYGLIHLFIIKISHFFKHGVQCTNRLAHIDHLYHHGWENSRFFQGFGNGAAFGNTCRYTKHGAFDNLVAGRAGNDTKRVQNRYTAL